MRRLTLNHLAVMLFFVVFLVGTPQAHADENSELMQLIVKVPTLVMNGKADEALPLGLRMVALSEKLNGPDNPITANAIGVLGDVYKARGQAGEAEQAYTRAIAILQKADANFTVVLLPPQLEKLAALYNDHGRHRDAFELLKQAITLREKSQDPVPLGIAWDQMGKTLVALGNYNDAESAFQRAVSFLEKKFGADNLIMAPIANNIAMLYEKQGRYAAAEKLVRHALGIYEKQMGRNHPLVAPIWSNLSEVQKAQGHFGAAEESLKRALDILENAPGASVGDMCIALSNLGTLYHTLGRNDEAESLLKRAFTSIEKLNPESTDVAIALNNLAVLYDDQGKYVEADKLYKRALEIRLKILGNEHPDVATVLNNIAVLYESQEQYEAASSLFQRAVAINEKALGSEHPTVALGLNNYAMIYQKMGRYADAEKLLLQAAAIYEKNAGTKLNKDVGTTLLNLASLYQVQERYEDALKIYEIMLPILEKTLGNSHPTYATALNNLATLYFTRKKWNEAVMFWEKSNDILIQRARRGVAKGGPSEASQKSELTREGNRFWSLVKANYQIQKPETAAKMFETAQWAQGSHTAQALAQMAARRMGGNGKLAQLIRERQDLVNEWQVIDTYLVQVAVQDQAKRNLKAEDEVRNRLAEVRARLTEIDGVLTKEFPDYVAMVSPEPLPVAELQKMLAEDEALVLFLDTPEKAPLPEETFVWVVTKTNIRWVRSDFGRTKLIQEVTALRCGLDTDMWQDETTCHALLGGSFTKQLANLGGALPFDLKRSHALYKALFGEVEGDIAGKRLLIVASGALTQLPFQVLVTGEPESKFSSTAYKNAKWLIRDHGLVVLPAVSSLKALRIYTKNHAERPFLGIGNPLLEGMDERYTERAKQARAKQQCTTAPTPQETVEPLHLPRSVGRLRFVGKVIDADALRKQAPLPETADELCMVGQYLRAKPIEVLLGTNASEKLLKTMSEQGLLADYRVIHFSTHGVMAGQIEGMDPGLILNPPAKGSEVDDGYLSASEIMDLKLNADWVILSACNTATGGVDNAEQLSGLVRSFFYAGARSVVASHWPVSSVGSVKLMTKAIEKMVTDKSIHPADALRYSMLELIDKGEERETHPNYWAPFVIVGEGLR
jgi:CHAT domain-containing protein/Flp pilus assembly protein TadD